MSACPVLAKEQYVKRHDKVSAQIHFNICKEIWVQLDKKHLYEQVPKSVITTQGGKVFILWNQQVQTDRTISSKKPDIIIRDNEKGTCMFVVQFLIPSDQRTSMVEIRTGGIGFREKNGRSYNMILLHCLALTVLYTP